MARCYRVDCVSVYSGGPSSGSEELQGGSEKEELQVVVPTLDRKSRLQEQAGQHV